MYIFIAAMLLAGSLFSFGCRAAENPQSQAKLAQQLNETREYWKIKIKNTVQFVVGNGIWQPGKMYKSGNDWLGLVCDGSICTLSPATLDAQKESWQGHYDEKPTNGQHLLFKQASPGKPVAWFRTTGAQPWLKQGSVPTYYAGGIYKQMPDKIGTMEFFIEMPDGKKAMLVPMLVRKSLLEQLAHNKENAQISYGAILLQLRTPEKRQLLPGVFGICTGEVTQNYLLWAGDLDGDGKPDFLVSYIDADGPVHLFLSGAAKRGQLVGFSGVFNSPPFGGECDGGPPSYLN
ncbi:MAG: hypothetical protein B7Y56_04995 [Gallionellales bacterium 35-53-114]|jgi:hypothetical protein|nr:MAG: hypothetical protein B7Y56_04995 [Gallionellales bacterium 35-53-114]OYZ65441.1 MAG: hypothetical protein B7Y04_02150 [Gallionellales bacterium 24-53-125]OZB08347.1 MAG: hypothetical protein B7X61_12605 [Gallionellales bacterium 39-52-133]HQS58290.1 FG-GAP repeat protein [Gallionellaceae bacterium]HQS73845.1 FG-GAP repeat protein [Gallionellaceae bacterium]